MRVTLSLAVFPFEDSVSAKATAEPYLFLTIHGFFSCSLLLRWVLVFFGSYPLNLAVLQAQIH